MILIALFVYGCLSLTPVMSHMVSPIPAPKYQIETEIPNQDFKTSNQIQNPAQESRTGLAD